jgi:hypothetical protein
MRLKIRAPQFINKFAPLGVIILLCVVEARSFRGQILLTSDSLFLHDISNSLLHGGQIRLWNFTQAPDYFPDLTLYLMIAIFVKSASIQLLTLTTIQSIILTSLFYSIFVGYSRKSTALLQSTILITAINLFQLKSRDWLYIYTTNNHFTSICFGLLCAWFLLRSKERLTDICNTRIFYISSSLFIILGTCSTLTFIYSVTIPSYLFITASLYVSRKSRWIKEILGLSLLCGLSTLTSLVITRLSPWTNSPIGRFELSARSVRRTNQAFFDLFKRNFLESGAVVSVLMSIFLALISLMILSAILSTSGWLKGNIVLGANDRWAVYSLITLFTTLLFTYFSGGIVDQFFLRYFWLPIFLALIWGVLTSNKLIDLIIARIPGLRCAPSLVVILMLTIFAVVDRPNYISTNIYQKTSSCISEIKSHGTKLESGVADYWYGRSIDYFSGQPISTYVALNTLEPFFWMTSYEPFIAHVDQKKFLYNYVLLHTLSDQFNFNTNTMKSILPTPSKVFSCKDNEMVIWFYNNTQLDSLVRLKQSEFLKVRKNHF